MKQYLKYLSVSIICSIFTFTGYIISVDKVLLSDIVLKLSLDEMWYYPQYITMLISGFIPLLLFQFIYGNYIYRHFSSASIYFFSRTKNRISWFLKEAFTLYIFSLLYLSLFVITAMIISICFSTFTIDNGSICLLTYYLVIYSLFLFSTSLLINILSIKYSSSTATLSVVGTELFFATFYSMMGVFFSSIETTPTKMTAYLIKINPFSRLLLFLQRSGIQSLNELLENIQIYISINNSVIYYISISILILLVGCWVINKHEFFVNNIENK